jgi:hypothetical protein
MTTEDKKLLAKLVDFHFRRATIANPATKKDIESKNRELVSYIKELNIKKFSTIALEEHLDKTIFKHVTTYFTGRFFN